MSASSTTCLGSQLLSPVFTFSSEIRRVVFTINIRKNANLYFYCHKVNILCGNLFRLIIINIKINIS